MNVAREGLSVPEIRRDLRSESKANLRTNLSFFFKILFS